MVKIIDLQFPIKNYHFDVEDKTLYVLENTNEKISVKSINLGTNFINNVETIKIILDMFPCLE